jgi:hypothetical protein
MVNNIEYRVVPEKDRREVFARLFLPLKILKSPKALLPCREG